MLVGKQVKLIRMEDPYTKLKTGDIGTIRGEDAIGNILVDWESGSKLSLIPNVDEYEIIDDSNGLSESQIYEIFDTPELKQANEIDYLKMGSNMIKRFQEIELDKEGLDHTVKNAILIRPELGFLYYRKATLQDGIEVVTLFTGNDEWFTQLGIYMFQGKARLISLLKPQSGSRNDIKVEQAYGYMKDKSIRNFIDRFVDQALKLKLIDAPDSRFLRN